MWLRPKIYKGNQQAIRLIVKNKNIHALMTKYVIQSFSESLLFYSNNKIVTQRQFIFDCINNFHGIIFDLVKCYIVSAIQ